jgi:hypothetical protein
VPAGYWDTGQLGTKFRDFVQFRYGNTGIIRAFSNSQVFLDHQVLRSLDLSPREVQETLAAELLGYEGIQEVYTAYQLWNMEYTKGMAAILQNGYHRKRSGDVLIVPAPATPAYSPTGSTHGSPYIYDTHVPLIFFGKGIQKGTLTRRTYIRDIAPTLAVLLGTAFPNGATGLPVSEALK